MDAKHFLEKSDQLEERFGSSIDILLFFDEGNFGLLSHNAEGERHELDNGISHGLFTEVSVFKELGGDVLESVIWPGMEPIDDHVVDEGWELGRTAPEVAAHGREAKTDVKILLHTIHEEIPATFL